MISPFPGPESPRFRNRAEAAARLATALAVYRGQRPLVLGIPRGGVVLADRLARELDGDLDIVLVRKLRAPDHPELAIGSITEQGRILMNEEYSGYAPELYLRQEAREALDLMRHRRTSYTPGEPAADPSGRVVIVVDDGIATGATMVAALRSLRESGALRVIAAAAVAPADTIERLRREADEVQCLATPEPFFAVSAHFDDFSEVSDEEVIEILRRRPQAQGKARATAELHHGNFGTKHHDRPQ